MARYMVYKLKTTTDSLEGELIRASFVRFVAMACDWRRWVLWEVVQRVRITSAKVRFP